MVKSIFKNFKGMFKNQPPSTTSRFLPKFFDPKFPVSMNSDLGTVIKYFDLENAPKILMIYVKVLADKVTPNRERMFFESPAIQEILKQCSFVGILSDEKDSFLKELKPKGSSLQFLFYDSNDKLQKSPLISFTRGKTSEVIQETQAVFALENERLQESQSLVKRVREKQARIAAQIQRNQESNLQQYL